MACLVSPVDNRRQQQMVWLWQEAGLAGLAVNVSTPTDNYSQPVAQSWLSHLPAGYRPGLVVELRLH